MRHPWQRPRIELLQLTTTTGQRKMSDIHDEEEVFFDEEEVFFDEEEAEYYDEEAEYYEEEEHYRQIYLDSKEDGVVSDEFDEWLWAMSN